MQIIERIRKIAGALRVNARRVRELETRVKAQGILIGRHHEAIMRLCDAMNGHTYAIHEMKGAISSQEFHICALREYIMEQAQTLPGERAVTQHGRGSAH